MMLGAARRRAARAGVPFDLSETDFDIPLYCPVLGVPIEKAMGRAKPNSPSLDRMIPDLGYIKGNVRVISMRANSIKGDASLAELEAVVKYIKENANG